MILLHDDSCPGEGDSFYVYLFLFFFFFCSGILFQSYFSISSRLLFLFCLSLSFFLCSGIARLIFKCTLSASAALKNFYGLFLDSFEILIRVYFTSVHFVSFPSEEKKKKNGKKSPRNDITMYE